MTIAEEMARERAAQREQDLNQRRGIDDLESLDMLETLDWEHDPWDHAVAAGSVERLRGQTRAVKWVAFTALGVSIALILVAGAVGLWYVKKLNPEGEPGGPVSLTVQPGETVESLILRLEIRGLIEDAGVFRWYVDRNGGLALTPGYYELRTSDHMGNILARLNTPPSQTYTKVTFPEGFTVAEMALRLDNAIVPMSDDDFLTASQDPAITATLRQPGSTSLEGLLFPDTYQVSNAESEAQVIERMLGQMERVADQEDIVLKGERLGQNPYGILIIASMIEEEAKTAEDRPKIARVIYNRLAAGLPLTIDAAVRYGTRLNGLDPDLVPFSEQRQVPGPYNTYFNRGLPLTPITNPGRASLHAALNPAPDPGVGDPLCVDLAPGVRCQYLYYVLADAEGNHAFAVTGDQHQANVDRAAAAGLLG